MALDQTTRDPAAFPPGSVTSPVTADMSVLEAWRRLRATGDTAAVVTRAGRPVAVVTRTAIEQAVAAGMEGAPVGRVADLVAVPVERSADAAATVRAFTRAAWDWLTYDRDPA